MTCSVLRNDVSFMTSLTSYRLELYLSAGSLQAFDSALNFAVRMRILRRSRYTVLNTANAVTSMRLIPDSMSLPPPMDSNRVRTPFGALGDSTQNQRGHAPLNYGPGISATWVLAPL